MSEPYWEPLSGGPGPQGIQGIQGPAGATGPQGPAGAGVSDAGFYGLGANHILTGGGIITFSASGRLKWTNRFISISRGSSYQNIDMPAVGTVITGIGGAANDTVTSEGILVNSWHSLYYVPSTNTLRIVHYSVALSPAYIPSDWLLIAQHNADQGIIWITPGIPLRPGESTGSDPAYVAGAISQVGPARKGKILGLHQGDGIGTYDALGLFYDDVIGKYVSNPVVINLNKQEFLLSGQGGGPAEFNNSQYWLSPCWISTVAYTNMGLILQLKYIVYGYLEWTGGSSVWDWRAWLHYQNHTGGSWGSSDLGTAMQASSGAEQLRVSAWLNVSTGYTAYSAIAPRLGWYGVGSGSLNILVRSASVQYRWVSA
jgi:hypothetical protein